MRSLPGGRSGGRAALQLPSNLAQTLVPGNQGNQLEAFQRREAIADPQSRRGEDPPDLRHGGARGGRAAKRTASPRRRRGGDSAALLPRSLRTLRSCSRRLFASKELLNRGERGQRTQTLRSVKVPSPPHPCSPGLS